MFKPQSEITAESSQHVSTISIVGGGLVGSLAALYFAKNGHDVNVFEYREDIRETQLAVGRSINLALSQRGRRALREVGLENEILQTAIPMQGRMLHDLKGNTRVVLYDPSNKQCLYSVGRKHLNEVLLNAGKKYPNVKYNFNTKLIRSNLKEGILTFKTVNTENSMEFSSSADLIVGCDGAFSTLRQQMLKSPGFNFSQQYIEHGYLELCIPAKNGEFQMPENYLHIWPRDIFMMIALPNQDRSFTVTLFMPFHIFAEITDETKLISFFGKHYPDALPLIGQAQLINDFFKTKPQHLVSVKCNPYNFGSKAVLIGDAAHAMVPFYGQGMNCGLEDCRILTSLIDASNGNIASALEQYTATRWQDAHAICDLAMYNYIEMRDLTKSLRFLLRKQLDTFLFHLFPNFWIPLYNSVSFSEMPYSQCTANRQWQDKILTNSFVAFLIALLALVLSIYWLNS